MCQILVLQPPENLSSVQSLSRVWLFATSWTAARQVSLSITNSRSLLKLMSVESVMPFSHLGLLMWLSMGSRVRELSRCSSWALESGLSSSVHRLSYLVPCGILLDQEWNPCLLHWQADSFFTTEPPGKAPCYFSKVEGFFSSKRKIGFVVGKHWT